MAITMEEIKPLFDEQDKLKVELEYKESIIAEMSKMLLELTRGSAIKANGISISPHVFAKLVKYSDIEKDHYSEDGIDNNVYVQWHGFVADCGDGATACNHILDMVEHVAEEND